MPSYRENRDELRAKIVRLRHFDKLTWSEIADVVGVKSAGTARNIYDEDPNRDAHTDLSGKPTRTFEPGDWCKDTCIAAEPAAKCQCRCGRYNHAGGPSKVIEILSAQGVPQDEIDARVLEISQMQGNTSRQG